MTSIISGKVRDNLEISNRGSRAAYVIVQAYKLVMTSSSPLSLMTSLFFRDAELTTEVDDVICVPSKFVIGSQRDVTIAISRRRADDVTTSAWIVIWFVLLQRFYQFLMTSSSGAVMN